MKAIVRKNPTEPFGKAIRNVRQSTFELYRQDESFYIDLLADLGSDSALEKMLLRVRHEIVWTTTTYNLRMFFYIKIAR